MRFVLLLSLTPLLVAADPQFNKPQFNKSGELIRPASDYREWIYLTSGVGMNYASDSSNEKAAFDNVFVAPAAYRAFKATGHWPDHTMFIKEHRQNVTKGSINKGGHFQGAQVPVLEIAVKETRRFPDGWGYFVFAKDVPATKALVGSPGNCNECHGKNGAVENTFVQFYPTLLEIAKAKGTLRQSYLQSSEAK
ncbi:MAG TPA: cytochrome P460 family protein [Bryobacteraceae bacterium]|jgi:hypothetical protein|nr:cytochrome P460 family protein [Bryobacteraceae bacterium]